MKRLIRNMADSYLARDGTWGDFDSAQQFADFKSALKACKDRGVNDAHLVMLIGETPDTSWDIVIPLDCNREMAGV